ncbi:MAG: hypothetical protein JNM91_02695 [Flavobacteriales bacterium]|nr:hypothetical protein [Flavobacteriales bacterium]
MDRNYINMYNPTTNQIVPLQATPNDRVTAMAPDGFGGWYIGGDFTEVGGLPRWHLARVNPDGTVGDWAPDVSGPGTITSIINTPTGVHIAGYFSAMNGESRFGHAKVIGFANGKVTLPLDLGLDGYVNSMAITGNTLFIQGTFQHVAGQSRGGLAAFDSATDAVLPWNPVLNGASQSIAAGGGKVFVTGTFNQVNGQPRVQLAGFDANTGALLPWNPSFTFTGGASIFRVLTTATHVYVSGFYTSADGQPRMNNARWDLSAMALSTWNAHIRGPIQDLQEVNNKLYITGAFGRVGSPERTRVDLAVVDATTGALLNERIPLGRFSWTFLSVSGGQLLIGGNTFLVGGATHSGLLFLDAATGIPTPLSFDISVASFYSSALRDNVLYLYGDADYTVNGTFRSRCCAIDLSTNTLLPWQPVPNAQVFAMAANSSAVYLGGALTGTSFPGVRNYAAAVHPTTGALLPWAPNFNNWVVNMAIDNDGVFAQGFFTSVNGAPRAGVARVHPTTGALHAWDPAISGTIADIALKGDTVFIIGTELLMNAAPPVALLAVNKNTGARYALPDTITGDGRGLSLFGNALDIVGNDLYVNGTAAGALVRMLLPEGDVLRNGPPAITSLATPLSLSLPDKVILSSSSLVNGYLYGNLMAFSYCTTPLTLHPDADGDGYGDPTVTVRACDSIPGYVTNGLDCNDTDILIHPNMYEACDGFDNDCDGSVDENSVASPWYVDLDGDGSGAGAPVTYNCMDQPGLVSDNSDCDDSVPGAYVGSLCEDGDPRTTGELWQPGCVCAADGVVYVRPRVLLQGPYDPATQLMNDGLRANGSVPLDPPWQSLGFTFDNGALEDALDPAALAITGPDAIVDHVLVEVRSAADPSVLLFSRMSFVQRDGDVVPSPPGTTCALYVPPGNYYIAIRHRNHMAVMTAEPIALGQEPVTVDLSLSTSALYGTNAAAVIGTRKAMWAGDVLRDNSIRYTGQGNDRDRILIDVGNTSPNSTTTGYVASDVNMDGVVKYTGAGNDRDAVLISVGGSTPNNVRNGQVP